MEVLASVLAFDFSILGQQIKEISKYGIDGFHFDIMDGYFVPNFSFGPDIIKSLKKFTDLEFEVHLMINEPFRYIKKFCDAGSDTIIFHIEKNSEPLECIKIIKTLGKKVGISINPKTNLEDIFPYLNYVDKILIMSVEPGFGGQEFMQDQLLKINSLKEKKNLLNLDFIIEIDGGINKETSKLSIDAGADSLVAGTFIMKSNDFENAIKILKENKNSYIN